MRADWYIWFDEVVYLGPNTGQDSVWASLQRLVRDPR
jgi:hypothetical protein